MYILKLHIHKNICGQVCINTKRSVEYRPCPGGKNQAREVKTDAG